MSMTLEYFYAIIDMSTSRCGGVITSSYKVNHPSYILIPTFSNDYYEKYYHEGLWYEDAEFSILAEGLN